MPNKAKTPSRNVRVPDDEWAEALAIAAERGESLAAHVIRPAIRRYIRRHRKEQSK